MKDRTHYIAMGGEHGYLPDNCSAYEKEEDAIEGLNEIYELNKRQLKELKNNGTTELKLDQGGAYCEVSSCDCDEPWEHDEFGDKSNWEEYLEEEEPTKPEEGDYIIECTGNDIIIYKYNDSPPWRHKVKDGDDTKKIISDEMEREKYWPNIWNLSDHGNLSITTLEEV